MEKANYIEAGEIVNTHGIHGQVKIRPWVDSPAFLQKFKTLYIDGVQMKVVSSRIHKSFVIAALEGCDDVNAAMTLKGKTVYIARADAHLPKGTFFLTDIIGSRVVTDGGEELGTLTDVMDLPANRVYVVEGEREYLIPAVPEFIVNTDIENGVITIHMMEGL